MVWVCFFVVVIRVFVCLVCFSFILAFHPKFYFGIKFNITFYTAFFLLLLLEGALEGEGMFIWTHILNKSNVILRSVPILSLILLPSSWSKDGRAKWDCRTSWYISEIQNFVGDQKKKFPKSANQFFSKLLIKGKNKSLVDCVFHMVTC